MTDHDPTEIDLEAVGKDPLTTRMRGRTIHKDLSFECAVITPITDDLWMGGWERGFELPEQVDHVVSLYRWGRYEPRRPLASELVVEMLDADDGQVESEQILALAHWVDSCRRTGTVLVHCQAGLNRSALVVGAALVLDGKKPSTAIELLRELRSPAVLCNQTFEDWLLGRLP